jgi:hypothetical protein
MSERLDTIEALGDDAVIVLLIARTITEYIDSTLDKVGEAGFADCSKLKTVDLPNVTHLGIGAFTHCYELSSVNFPKVTSMNSSGFGIDGACKLTYLSMPSLLVVPQYSIGFHTTVAPVELASATKIET